MSYEPCQNPNCKSFGRPHPNCRCHGSFAKGGEVRFCGSDRQHQSDCEYFAPGGFVGELSEFEPLHAVAGHLLGSGLVGVLKMDRDHDLNKYEKSSKKGHKNLHDTVDIVFDGGAHDRPDMTKHHDHIHEWMAKGGILHNIHEEFHKQNAPQMLAHGGVAKHKEGVLHNHPIEHAYPEQNIALQAAKGRAANYLNSIKPQENAPRLAFDDNQDQGEAKKNYKDAVKIAAHPMSVLHKVSDKTLNVDDIKHLKAMYPEVHEAIQKKVTEKIVKSQLSGKKPPHAIRQSLSLLMGTALSGELTPQSIQAAQATFVKTPPPATGQPQKKKPNTDHLTKSDQSYLTGQQALTARQQRQS